MSSFTATVNESFLLAGRGLRQVRRVPERLIDVTIQPVIFVMLFAFVFGSAIAVPGGSYREFLVSGMLAQTMTFAAASMAVGVASDMQEGVIDRFRSLPISRVSVLAGRTLAELAQNLLGLVITALSGLVVGWRIHTGVLHTLAALGVLLAFGLALNWAGTLIGLVVRSPDAAQGVFFVSLFPLTFASGVFVPTVSMTPWLRDFANWNPVTALATSVRGLLGNPTSVPQSTSWALHHATLLSLLWSLGFLLVFAPLAVRLYIGKVSK